MFSISGKLVDIQQKTSKKTNKIYFNMRVKAQRSYKTNTGFETEEYTQDIYCENYPKQYDGLDGQIVDNVPVNISARSNAAGASMFVAFDPARA